VPGTSRIHGQIQGYGYWDGEETLGVLEISRRMGKLTANPEEK
jgi:hypothetical protein